MSYKKSIIKTIRDRKSIRTYDSTPISHEDYKKILEYIKAEENLIGPFGRVAKLQIFPVSKNISDKGIKVGTYGFIKNPKGYIVGIIQNRREAFVDFGFIFEKLILFLTSINIGTCWLGGTFNRNSFTREIKLEKNEVIPCITPIGYKAERKRVFEKTLRYITKADNRKSWEELFFYKNLNNPLDKGSDYSIPLEMVRLAPSASNKQPWIIILREDEKKVDFYLNKTPNYNGNNLGFEIQRIDIGIAMCHFELSSKEIGMDGQWTIQKPEISPSKDIEYIATWIRKL